MDSSADLPRVALVLAGGLGTRLRTAVSHCPKVLAEVGGEPFVTHLLRWLAGAGVTRTILCTGYRAQDVRDALGSQCEGMRLEYSEESRPLGTAGALRLAVERFDEPSVLVLNGDSWCALDLSELGRAHDTSTAEATLCAVDVDDCERFGRVTLDGRGQVRTFEEKGDGGPGSVNAGIYIFPRAWIAELAEGEPASLERDVLPGWARRGIHVHRVRAPFVDIGTPASWASAAEVIGGARP